MTDEQHTQSQDAAERISREIAAVHEESYGSPPRKVKTHLVEDGVLCVIDIDLLPHELTLLDNGQGADSIRAVRSDFQTSIRSTFVAAVEHSTGRRVSGFISDTHLDPPFSVEFFRLATESAAAGAEEDSTTQTT